MGMHADGAVHITQCERENTLKTMNVKDNI